MLPIRVLFTNRLLKTLFSWFILLLLRSDWLVQLSNFSFSFIENLFYTNIDHLIAEVELFIPFVPFIIDR